MLSNSSSLETIGGNNDVISEILIRLPVKPLVGFKCVSKQWLSLISDPHFSHRHTHHRRTPSSSAILLRRTPSDDHFQFVSLNDNTHHSKPPFTSLRFINDTIPSGGSNLKILQSCNGLFLCRTFSFSNTNQNHCYYVVNPTTKQFSTLAFTDTRSRIFGVILVFEPSKSPYYQVVCVRSTAGSLYQIEIYSSKTRSWMLSGSPFVAPFDMVFDNGVFFNGGVHWVSPSGASLCFDIDKDTLGKLPSLPVSDRSEKRRFRYFGESGGHLHLIDIYGPRTSQFKVFEMERDYSNWFVKYEVDLDPIIATFPEMVRDFVDPCDSFSYAFVIMFLIRKEKEDGDDDSLLLHIPGKILSYNLKHKTFKKICELTPHRNQSRTSSQFGWLDAYQYVETLACV